MDMNRAGRSFLSILCGLLCGCSEEDQAKLPEPVGYESESVLQLHPSGMTGERIDWSEEADLLRDDDLLARLASAVGAEKASLTEMIRYEFEILEKRVRIIVRDEEPRRAEAICQAYADLYLEFRKEREVRLAAEALERLDHELARSEAEVRKSRAELEKLLTEHGLSLTGTEDELPTLEQDRLTYQKALEALRENSQEEMGVPEGGVLFRKEEDQ